MTRLIAPVILVLMLFIPPATADVPPACVGSSISVCGYSETRGDIDCEMDGTRGYRAVWLIVETRDAERGVILVPYSCGWYEGHRYERIDALLIVWSGSPDGECYFVVLGEAMTCPLAPPILPREAWV